MGSKGWTWPFFELNRLLAQAERAQAAIIFIATATQCNASIATPICVAASCKRLSKVHSVEPGFKSTAAGRWTST
jgi:hypothetical protein